MSTTVDDLAEAPFSATLRARTTRDHRDAETSPLMRDLLRGTIDRAGLGAFAAQHLVVYRALEEVAEARRDDPVVAPFLLPGLARVPALEHDVALLLGPGTPAAVVPTPGAAAYAARLHEVADWPAGIVAHHYTRYMGDLSGGQHIGRIVARTHPDLDLRFYDFATLGDLDEVKDRYRALLDAAPWSTEEQERFIDEVRLAYELNTRLFADLG